MRNSFKCKEDNASGSHKVDINSPQVIAKDCFTSGGLRDPGGMALRFS